MLFGPSTIEPIHGSIAIRTMLDQEPYGFGLSVASRRGQRRLWSAILMIDGCPIGEEQLKHL